MPLVVDLYARRESWVHEVDPRVKLLFVASSLLLLIVFKNVFILATALVLVHLLHWSANIPRSKFVFVWKTLLPVSLVMFSLWVIFYPTGEPILQLWVIKITRLSIAQGLVLALRILSMAFVVFAWLYTTDHASLVRSLVKLKLPFEWGLVLALALRYIPTFQGMYGLITEAQQARGLNISQGTGFRRVRTMMPIFVAMVISSLRASDQLAKAMESRAFGARGVQRTALYDIEFRPLDYVFTVLMLILVIGLLYLNLRFGFGTHPLNLFG
ncbi:MAG: energy-coupling factor transporter transmembrane component T family protein [Anaerolineales bacterium]